MLFQQAVREVFREFCTKSSIHGVQYFFERRRHWTERSKLFFIDFRIQSITNKIFVDQNRSWWIIFFGLSVWLCGSSIQNIWIKWRQEPVTMTFTQKELKISDIPFPTVTICPETKAYAHKLNITSAYHLLKEQRENLTDIELGTAILESLWNSHSLAHLRNAQNFWLKSKVFFLDKICYSIRCFLQINPNGSINSSMSVQLSRWFWIWHKIYQRINLRDDPRHSAHLRRYDV